jgi:5-methylthioadenosine/S-adenosylhomocysteine deaminase
MYYFEEEVARAAREAGLRAVAGETIIRFPSPDAKTPQEALARAERFIREWRHDGLVVPAVAPHALYTLDAPELQASRALADRYGVPLLIHLAETEDEVTVARERLGAASPVAYLDRLGFFGPRTLAAHGVHLSTEDIAILRRREVAVAHNPESNMKLASGTAPVPALRRAGVTVAVGTDGAASNNDLDMFEAMRQAALLHKLVTRDPRAVPAAAALEMATLGGARALGLADRIGSLEPGKRADLIVVSMEGARQTPLYDPLSHLVYVAKGTDVTTTIVDGRILMRDRRVRTLDARAVLAEARAMAETVRAAVR